MISQPDNDLTRLEGRFPSCLERREDRAIVISGHRVTLFNFLRAVKELQQRHVPVTATAIADFFPSIAVEVLAEVLDFTVQHPEPIWQYFEKESEIASRNAGLFPYMGPTVEELRDRRRTAG